MPFWTSTIQTTRIYNQDYSQNHLEIGAIGTPSDIIRQGEAHRAMLYENMDMHYMPPIESAIVTIEWIDWQYKSTVKAIGHISQQANGTFTVRVYAYEALTKSGGVRKGTSPTLQSEGFSSLAAGLQALKGILKEM